MKKFSEYIEEARATAGSVLSEKLSFEDFEKCIQFYSDESTNHDFFDIADFCCDVFSKILNTTEPNARRMLRDFVAIYDYNVPADEVKTFYNFFMNLNTQVASKNKYISAGCEGVVFSVGNDVIKFFYKPIEDRFVEFFKNLKRHNYVTLPKIKHLYKSYFVMERLEIKTKKCKELSAYFMNYGYDYSPEDCDWVNEWKDVFEEEAEESGLSKFLDSFDDLDYHSGNFGERPNGDIVFFDPLYMNL